MPNYCHFTNKDCEFFPCHGGVDAENFNCLFCYCPLYALGTECSGNFRILENGVKDCTDCTFPHRCENYDAVIAKLGEKG